MNLKYTTMSIIASFFLAPAYSLAQTSCFADLNLDGKVGQADLNQVLGGVDISGDGVSDQNDISLVTAYWGPCSCTADFNQDGQIGMSDLVELLANLPSSLSTGTNVTSAPQYDVDGNGFVNTADVQALQKQWGPCSFFSGPITECMADIDNDNNVGFTDLLAVQANFMAGGKTDIDGSGTTDSRDLAIVEATYGPCREINSDVLNPTSSKATLKRLKKALKTGRSVKKARKGILKEASSIARSRK